MKEKEKSDFKEVRKRKVSVFTVCIWMLLIVTMSVIVIQGIRKTNALEEETRTITVKVDFSEYFEKEGIEGEKDKVYFMDEYQYNIAAVKTNNVTQESDMEGISRYIRNEGNVGVYEIYITEETKYIGYHVTNYIPYSIESSTSEIEYINAPNGIHYGERIKEGIDEYEVKLKKRTITVKVDFSEYFEKEGIEEETDKVGFIMNYQQFIGAVKTNNVTQESDIDGIVRHIRNEGNVGVYEIYITEETKYIIYHQTSYPDMLLNLYSIESSTSEIEYINVYDGISYGERIKEGIDEYEVKLKKRTITVKVDFSEFFEEEGIEEETVKVDFIMDYYQVIAALKTNNVTQDSDIDGIGRYIRNEGNMGVYEIYITEEAKYIGYHQASLSLYNIESITGEIEYINVNDGIGYGEKIKEGIDEYEVKLKYFGDTHITKKAKWIDKEKGIATISLGYTDVVYFTDQSLKINYNKIYIDRISEEFELSPEYNKDSRWKILETVDNENLLEMKNIDGKVFQTIPVEVYNEFYASDDNSYTNIKYVYVKDTKTIYWCSDVSDINKNVSVNVVYRGYGNESEGEEIETNKGAKLFDFGNNYFEYSLNEIYNIASPKLKYVHTKEGIIKVEKEVEEEIGENKYYVGIFENEEEEKTDKIYEIETIDGKGNTVVEIPNYNSKKEYYIYEVDSTGNKISDESIEYSSNKMEFEYIRDAKIESDKSVVSSVMSDRWEDRDRNNVDESKWHEYINEYGYTEYYFETDEKNSVGTGEEDYIDNVLSVNDIYQANITISSKNVEKKENFKVEYVAEEGGSLNGELEEKVESGNTPKNIPIVKVEDGYRFVRWEVEENGERIEVIPSEYVVLKDTVFYAIFEKVEEKPLDTSDINIFVYIVIAFIAIVGLIVGIIFVTKKAKNKK